MNTTTLADSASTPTEQSAVIALPVGAVVRVRFGSAFGRVHRTSAAHFADRLKHRAACLRTTYRAHLTVDLVDCQDCLARRGDHWPDVTACLLGAQA